MKRPFVINKYTNIYIYIYLYIYIYSHPYILIYTFITAFIHILTDTNIRTHKPQISLLMSNSMLTIWSQ